mmetsp:Transcript_33504/g.78802  ORF Transcript_33504/g.78802 Transcript_33504/m.78802 type:complete len:152 (+) Transcript_33504:1073-1528(+)
MLSYKSNLKAMAAGRADLRAALSVIEKEGYDNVWWDWLVVDENVAEGRSYVQHDFEVAMRWAHDSATAIFVVWPTVADARNYLQRPWCCAELIAACQRGAHVVCVRDVDALYEPPSTEMELVQLRKCLLCLYFVSFYIVSCGNHHHLSRHR